MFANPQLNRIFSNLYCGFYIYSNDAEIEIIFKQLANLLAQKLSILYISSDFFGLEENVYVCDINNIKALKELSKYDVYDFIFIENISFLPSDFIFLSKSKIIACGFLKSDLRHFNNLNYRFIRFDYTNAYISLSTSDEQFKYYFYSNNFSCNSLFSVNKSPKNIDDEIDFYIHCIQQGFMVDDFRSSRASEINHFYSYSQPVINDIRLVVSKDFRTFNLHNKKIAKDFIPNKEIKFYLNLKNMNKIVKKQNTIKNSTIFSYLKSILFKK